jgi:hypothetical protein
VRWLELLSFVFGVHASQRLDDVDQAQPEPQPAGPRALHVPHPVRLRVPSRITAVHLRRDRRAQTRPPAPTSGLAPVAHSAPPASRLWPADDVESTMAMPKLVDLDDAIDFPFEARLACVTLAVEQGLHAVHEAAASAVDYHLECWSEARDRFDDFAVRLWRDDPVPVAASVAVYGDVPVPFATGRRRAPAPERPSVAGLFPALPTAPARHALPGGAK